MEWLVPIGLFWPVAAGILGGWPIDIVGGNGLRQVMGVVVSFVFFLVVWRVLGLVLGGLGGIFWDIVVPTALSLVALPAILWAGYRTMGVWIGRSRATH